MTVTLRRRPLGKEDRDLIADAILNGAYADESPELGELALTIAERLPDLLRKAGMTDTREHRRQLIDLVLIRWSAPKGPRTSRSYRRLARQ